MIGLSVQSKFKLVCKTKQEFLNGSNRSIMVKGKKMLKLKDIMDYTVIKLLEPTDDELSNGKLKILSILDFNKVVTSSSC